MRRVRLVMMNLEVSKFFFFLHLNSMLLTHSTMLAKKDRVTNFLTWLWRGEGEGLFFAILSYSEVADHIPYTKK